MKKKTGRTRLPGAPKKTRPDLRPIHYTVISSPTIAGLVEGVNLEVQNGYRPCGGILKDYITYNQAMWKPLEIVHVPSVWTEDSGSNAIANYNITWSGSPRRKELRVKKIQRKRKRKIL